MVWPTSSASSTSPSRIQPAARRFQLWANRSVETSSRNVFLTRLGLAIFISLIIGLIAYLVVFRNNVEDTWRNARSGNSGSRGLPDGCYNAAGVPMNIFLNPDLPSVNQSSAQCQGVKQLALELGFLVTPASACSKNTTFTAGDIVASTLETAHPNPTFTALFCNENTVAIISISNPPNPLSSIPPTLREFRDLFLFHASNVFYGDRILQPLFSVLDTPKYFRSLDLSGSHTYQNVSTRILNGTIPDLPEKWAKPDGVFQELLLANNNLSGGLPISVSDSLAFLSVANNTRMGGPLNISYFSTIDKSASDWTHAYRCGFENTNFCVPETWRYQPACLRSTPLPTCGDSRSVDRSINPNDPFQAQAGGTGGSSSGNGSSAADASLFNQIGAMLRTLFILLLAFFLFSILFLIVKRCQMRRGLWPGYSRPYTASQNSGTTSDSSQSQFMELEDRRGLPPYVRREGDNTFFIAR
ncbi:hypothetical protein CcCBS67573_g03432 [Chytriomyces confervae]|uniref:L domain-like protein n=1 Tax=Chytriomyces confervae TaxID=246404 RepID=A0A507FIV5_9FUNG|nr:hypothetical protein CcCBS67573_g03432 [Chytriomyces confervae]